MFLGFALFGFQAFVVWFLVRSFFLEDSGGARLLGALLFCLKMLVCIFVLLFFPASSVSLVDFFLGALLSFGMFSCFLIALQ